MQNYVQEAESMEIILINFIFYIKLRMCHIKAIGREREMEKEGGEKRERKRDRLGWKEREDESL